jgi:hypothetical protein
MTIFKKTQSDEERFFSKVEFDEWNRDDCWLWKGRPTMSGYGQFSIGPLKSRRTVTAHIWCYEFFNGAVPEGKQLHHNCENTLCVNPNHLEALTAREHFHRSKKIFNIGAWQVVRGLARTHCWKGHPYSGDNLYVRPNGTRLCRQCAREAARRYRRKEE